MIAESNNNNQIDKSTDVKIAQYKNIELYYKKIKILDTEIPISKKETKIWNYFMNNPERNISREEVEYGVWDKKPLHERSLDVWIFNMKSKLPKEYQNVIHTSNANGYNGFILSDTHKKQYTQIEELIIDYLSSKSNSVVQTSELVQITHGRNDKCTKRSLAVLIHNLKKKLPKKQISPVNKNKIIGHVWNSEDTTIESKID